MDPKSSYHISSETPLKDIWDGLLKILTSYRLAAVVLALLTFLTLMGTLNQIDESILHTQKKYFESAFVADMVEWFPVLMPGGYLLMAILFFNMLAGTILKMRRNWKGLGLYIVHFGILLLVVSAAVTMHFSREGNMAVRPGTQSNEVLSFHHWQMDIIPVKEDGTAEKALVIPHDELKKIGWNGSRSYTADELPFEVVIKRFALNAQPMPANAPMAARSNAEVIDGWKLLNQPLAKESEANMAGAYVEFVPKNGGESHEAIIMAHPFGNLAKRTPYPVEFDGKTYGVQISRERMQVPFAIRVDEFIFDKYAGVATARNYQSNVTKIEDGQEEAHIIKMNEPLRHGGFTFFQASFGPSAEADPEDLYPVFQVVKNPSDHWPLVSMWIVMFGLFYHLVMKLVQYLVKPSRAKVPAKASATSEPAEATTATTP